MIYIRELIEPTEIVHILKDTLPWVSGNLTASGTVKHNLQLDESPARGMISNIVFAGLDADSKFLRMTAAASSSRCIVSRTPTGGKYGLHHDVGTLGDYSTTVFLSDPDTYDGGELLLHLPEGPKRVKLPAGHAVTYTTGIPHEVLPVTSGHRDAAVFWTHSLFQDEYIRNLHYDLTRAAESLDEGSEASHLIAGSVQSLVRRYGRHSF